MHVVPSKSLPLWLLLLALGGGPHLRGQVSEPTPNPAAGRAKVTPQRILTGTVIDEITREPMAGLTVLLYGAESITATTDVAGRFRFEDLSRDQYGLTVSPETGYSASHQRVAFTASRPRVDVALTVGRTSTVSGRVVDADGNAMAGVHVSMLEGGLTVHREPPGRRGSGITNDRGEFRVERLVPGTYVPFAVAGKRKLPWRVLSTASEDEVLPEASPGMVPTYYPNVIRRESALEIAVRRGQNVEGIQITMASTETPCVRTGRILGPSTDGGPVRLSIYAGWFLGAPPVFAADLDGREPVEICGLAPGDYRLVGSYGEGKTGALLGSVPFTLVRRSMALPSVVLRPLGPLEGRLVIHSVADPRPVLPQPVLIDLRPLGRSRTKDEIAFVRTGAEGSFTIPGVAMDAYRLTVRPPQGFYVRSATLGTSDGLQEPIHPEGGELTVTLGADGPTLQVLVTGEEQTIPASCIVILGRYLTPDRSEVEVMAKMADQGGRVEFGGIAPGEYRLLAVSGVPDAAAMNPQFFQSRSGEGERVELKAGERKQVSVRVVVEK